MTTVIVDTSTLIKGLLRQYSEPVYIVNKILDETFRLAMSDEMAKELLVTVELASEKYNKNVKPMLRNVARFLLAAQKFTPPAKFSSCSDPEDTMFIDCAIESQCQYVVSSDPSIFDVKNYVTDANDIALIHNIEFFTPQLFYNECIAGKIKI